MPQPVLAAVDQHRATAELEQERTVPLVFRRLEVDISPGPSEGEFQLDAPAARVWQAWTDCDRLRSWWGPSGYTVISCHLDVRVGGRFLLCLRSPDGKEIWSAGLYREIVPGRRLVVTDSFSDEQGNVVSPTRYGFAPDFPEELLLIVTLDEVDGETALSVRHRGLPLGEDYGATRIGWSQALNKLATQVEPARAAISR
jgi:uncharacterized protein YndB with AHSA1/START domain